jgi:hypothetical protein
MPKHIQPKTEAVAVRVAKSCKIYVYGNSQAPQTSISIGSRQPQALSNQLLCTDLT